MYFWSTLTGSIVIFTDIGSIYNFGRISSQPIIYPWAAYVKPDQIKAFKVSIARVVEDQLYAFIPPMYLLFIPHQKLTNGCCISDRHLPTYPSPSGLPELS